MKSQKKDVWKCTGKRRESVYIGKKKVNEKFGRKMNEDVSGNRKYSFLPLPTTHFHPLFVKTPPFLLLHYTLSKTIFYFHSHAALVSPFYYSLLEFFLSTFTEPHNSVALSTMTILGQHCRFHLILLTYSRPLACHYLCCSSLNFSLLIILAPITSSKSF